MKKCKRLMCFVLAALMILPINVPAFALETQENGNRAKDEGNPFTIEVSTNKSEYSTLGVAKIDVTITNTSSEEIQNVSAEAVFKQLAPAGRKSETKKEVDTLKAGESISFSYKATINKEEYKLNFFQKVFLWIVRLFNGGFTAKDNGFDDGRECTENVTTIKFGKFDADNMVKVWYGKSSSNGRINEKSLEQMSEAKNAINEFCNSKKYKNLETIEERKEAIEKLLIELSEKGTKNLKEPLIKKDTITYHEENQQFYFEYICGISSGIYLNVSFKNGLAGSYSFSNSLGYSYRQNNLVRLASSTNESISKSIMLYGWDNFAVSETYSKWKKTVDNCNSRGLNMSMLEAPSINTYRSILLKNDFICIAEHGFNYKTDDNKVIYTFAVFGENITPEKDDFYDTDIDAERIYQVYNASIDGENHRDLYLITPNFFRHYYGGNLKNSVIFLSSCMGFGENGKVDYEFAKTFVDDCGASAVIGFHNSVLLDYANDILDFITWQISSGETVSDAFNDAKKFHGDSDKKYAELYGRVPEYISDKEGLLPAYPFLYTGEGDISGVVKDSTTNCAIADVNIEVIVNSIDSSKPLKTTTTDESGSFSIRLPYGSYSVSFNHDNYEYHGISLNVDSDYVVLSEPILLTPKSTNIPSTAVEFNGHYYQYYATENAETWAEASAFCKGLGGHLATISSKDENDFLYNYIKSQNVKSAYFGLTDKEKEGTWVWDNGEASAYRNWHSGEPNSENSNEDYAMFYYKYSEGLWNDGDFTGAGTVGGKAGFICEWDSGSKKEQSATLKYPTSQKYWVIFKEGFRNDRIELSTFDTELQEGSFHIIWDGNLLLSNDDGMSRCEQFSIVNNQWNKDREYGILTDWATEIIASNVDIYDGEGNFIKAKTDYSKISMDMLQ